MLTGIGPKTLEKLEKLGIKNTFDLIYHFPTRYVDFSHTVKISQVEIGQNSTISGKIVSFQNIFTRSHKNIQKATIRDNSGSINILWFNQPYLNKVLTVGETCSFAGEASLYLNKATLIAPLIGKYHTGKIIAIYPQTLGLTSAWFRKTIQTNISLLTKDIIDPLPATIIKKNNLLSLSNALWQIHCPTNLAILNQARFRLSIDEILSIQSLSFLQKKSWEKFKPSVIFKDFDLKPLFKKLKFELTKSQIKAWGEIKEDLLSQTKPMNRLLCGDVGSGKTILSVFASYLAQKNNSLSIFLAPTEILAQQHFKVFSTFLSKVYLLTTNSKIDLKKIPKNSIIISTHAILYQQKNLPKVGLLVIDEQHKFGVKQRSFLSSLNPPHTLTMTATPIPRTISLTLLGNLNLSTLDEMPKDRIPIKTFVVPKNKTHDCYLWLQKHIKETKEQAFFVCPFIDISESMATVKAASEEFEKISKFLPTLNLALIHGKIKNTPRQKILDDFAKNKINILVTTPIIEVGIDYPNASTIIIESADRFGLAQLHQLRGRVGRGDKQSYCYLFSQSDNEKSMNRLKFLEKNNSGFKIAEFDLKTRGPGEIFSTIQHGFPSLKLADISDIKLISLSENILAAILKTNPRFDLNLLIPHPNPTLHTLQS